MPSPSDRTDWKPHKATDAAIKRFEEQYGRRMGPSSTLTRSGRITSPKVIPTGSLALDEALVIGGWPVGYITELWGPEHQGKTSLAMLAVAEAQRMFPDQMCAWTDMEQTFDEGWAAALGVDLTRLWRAPNPRTAEDAADSHRDFVASGLCSLVVLDSVGSMISKDEYEREADEDARVAQVARVVTRLVKQISPMGKAMGVTSIIVNQVRAIINGARHGPTTGTGGGWALKHGSAVKARVARGGSPPHTVQIHGKPVPVSYESAVKIEKLKFGPAGRVGNYWLTNQNTTKWGPIGVDKADEAATIGVRNKIIVPGGAWYTTPDGERHNGRDRLITHLRAHPELVADIRARMLAGLAGEIKEEPDEPAEELAGNEEMV
jgi:recombination protein RecA